MHIALVHNALLPVQDYGGTERVLWWLAKGLSARGVRVTLACSPLSQCPFARVVPFALGEPLEKSLPDVDVFHYFASPPKLPARSYLVTIHGNGKLGETFFPNTVFVSRNHAERHGSLRYVYNGVDPDDTLFSEKKNGYLLFLAKASWRVKNVKGAVRFAREANWPLHILGGRRLFFNHWRGVHWEGRLGGRKKMEFLAGASALLWPVVWNEPFGIAVVEALLSGTPVIASRRGSSPELIDPSVGFLCDTEEEFIAAIGKISTLSANACRAWAMDRFHYTRMAEDYIKIYAEILAGKCLNLAPLAAKGPPEEILPLGRAR